MDSCPLHGTEWMSGGECHGPVPSLPGTRCYWMHEVERERHDALRRMADAIRAGEPLPPVMVQADDVDAMRLDVAVLGLRHAPRQPARHLSDEEAGC